MKGTETIIAMTDVVAWFYSSVILKGTETKEYQAIRVSMFYSSVILKGTETKGFFATIPTRFTVVLY